MELLAEVTIPKYVRQIMTTKSRGTKYYEFGMKKRPKTKYKSPTFDYLPFNVIRNGKKTVVKFLANVSTGEKVIANPKTKGTPKYKIINGQDLHTLRLEDYERSAIIRAIKAQMIPIVNSLDRIKKFPLRILCEIHDTIDDELIASDPDWDVDNRMAFYSKVFQDVLSGCKSTESGILKTTTKQIIPDDHRGFITQSPTPLFVPIEDSENRKLVFKIYHDDRECIQSHSFYKDINYLYGAICPNCQGKKIELNNKLLTCPYCNGKEL
jgi:hypothetical protein